MYFQIMLNLTNAPIHKNSTLNFITEVNFRTEIELKNQTNKTKQAKAQRYTISSYNIFLEKGSWEITLEEGHLLKSNKLFTSYIGLDSSCLARTPKTTETTLLMTLGQIPHFEHW